MKNNSVIILICMALFAVNVCNSKNNNGNNQTVEIMEDKTQVKEPVLGLGQWTVLAGIFTTSPGCRRWAGLPLSW